MANNPLSSNQSSNCTNRTEENSTTKLNMESRIAEDHKSSPRRDFRLSRSGRNQKAVAQNILEAIAQFSGGGQIAAAEDGRMKIVVKREDLKQVMEAIRDGRSFGRRESAAAVLEQRLNLLRRRQILRAAAASKVEGRSRGNWRPALQSIPEEL